MSTDTAAAPKQEYTFQAEIKRLLDLLSHSLYQNREITLRELISNASDSLNKFRHVQLTDGQYRTDDVLEITLEPDKTARTLTIRDNGVGLTHDELVANLGTIAHSGSLEFLNQLSGDAKQDLSLIGQFGVGFYSAFMLAERVEVLTKSYRDDRGWRWESSGDGRFTIEPVEGLARGAQVKLHLKADLDEFTDTWRLKQIVRKYSTFIPQPIKLEGEQLNEQRPIWVEPKSQLTSEQYAGFYQHLTHRTDEQPLWHLHLSSDSPLQFHAVLYCPPSNFELLGYGRIEHGQSLCAKRILVQDDCRDLLPEYLRFLYGLVDSADLPLNISRETLQDSTIVGKIRKVLTKKVLDHLAKMAADDAPAYRTFYEQFGMILRTGISIDFENREKVAKLLRFHSTHEAAVPETDTDDDNDNGDGDGQPALISLDDYIQRAPAEQKQIYFLGGPDLESARKNPNLEIFLRKKLEVLLLDDAIDEMMLSNLHTYEGRDLRSIEAADLEFPPETEAEKAAKAADEAQADKPSAPPAGFERVLELFRETLGDLVSEVRESKRLTDSPCCLVNPRGAMGTQLQKIMKMTTKDFEMSKRILEVNPSSGLIQRLSTLSANPEQNSFIQDCGRQLYASALMLEGILDEPQEIVSRMQTFMDQLAAQREPK